MPPTDPTPKSHGDEHCIKPNMLPPFMTTDGQPPGRGNTAMTPEQQARVDVIRAAYRTPEARAKEAAEREAIQRELRETGTVALRPRPSGGVDQRFPAGWDEQRIKAVLGEFDNRTEEEWVADDEAALEPEDGQTVITVPHALLPAIRRLLAEHAAASPNVERVI
jgi:hypothetical protein